MRIIFFGTYDENRHPRVRVLREGFAELGDEVLVCNEPLLDETAGRVAILQAPWRAFGLLVTIARAWLRLRRRARAMPRPDVLVVGYMGHLDVRLARRIWPRVPLVLDHLVSLRDTAVDRRLGVAWLRRLLGIVDRRAIAAADIVLVDTEGHRDLVPREARSRSMVVPVGAPRAWFRAPLPRRDGPLRVIFFGLYTPLQGAPVIGAAIGLLAGQPVSFTMVGAGQDFDATRAAARTNDAVRWLDWVEPGVLPELVASHDVCLGIFGTGPKALRVTPNKVFQGAAAGCAIVTSDTPPQRCALEDAAVWVPPGDPLALAEALRDLATDPERLAAMRKAASNRAEGSFTPGAVVAKLRAVLPSARRAPPLPPLAPNAWLRWDLIERALPTDAKTFLEVGAGQGAIGARIARHYEYVGVEPDPVSSAVAASRLEGVGRVINADLDALDAAWTFDVVGAFEVLEHFEDDLGALRAWREHIREGGWLLLSVPAHQRRFGAWDRRVGHYRRYGREQLEQLLAESGFGAIEVWAFGFPIGYALETGRNLIASRDRRLAEYATATAASGRQFQPTSGLAPLTRAGTAPFRFLQRAFVRSDLGTGFVARARRA